MFDVTDPLLGAFVDVGAAFEADGATGQGGRLAEVRPRRAEQRAPLVVVAPVCGRGGGESRGRADAGSDQLGARTGQG